MTAWKIRPSTGIGGVGRQLPLPQPGDGRGHSVYHTNHSGDGRVALKMHPTNLVAGDVARFLFSNALAEG